MIRDVGSLARRERRNVYLDPRTGGSCGKIAYGFAVELDRAGQIFKPGRQVVDKGNAQGNWLETSSSSMYTFAMWMGVQRGYLDKHFKDVALKGYKGVLTKVSLGQDGLANIVDICEGTNVADAAYYYARKRNSNDFHGIGAFLIMTEELRTSGGGKAPKMDWTAK